MAAREERGKGIPLTEEQRHERHKAFYGAEELPPRGSGLERDKMDNIAFHIAEHVALGTGKVLDTARAEATPCGCFEYEGETYCHSPGVLGLISSKKNPEQLERYCKVRTPVEDGRVSRFREIQSAISEAHEEWEKEGGGLPGWWDKVGKKMEEKGIEL